MSSIFETLTDYGKWNEKSRRAFTDDEKQAVASVTVTPSEFGVSAQFLMVSGAKHYMPIASTSKHQIVGETLDINELQLVSLEKAGKIINRVE